DISTPLAKREKLTSFLTIAGQTSSFLTRLNVLRSIQTLKFQDVLITPDLDQIDALDFKEFPKAELRGLVAAREQADELNKYSVGGEEYAEFRKTPRVPRDVPVIDAVKVAPVRGVDSRLIAHRVDTKPGPLDWRVLEGDLARLYEIGDYQTVDFRIDTADGKK